MPTSIYHFERGSERHLPSHSVTFASCTVDPRYQNIRLPSYHRVTISKASLEWFGGIRVDLMDGIDVSRGGDGVPQRQHRIVPRNMYHVSFVCLCVSYRQHINLVLTYLLLVRLVDPRFITYHPLWKRCSDEHIFLRCIFGFIDESTHIHKSTCPIVWLLMMLCPK